MTTDQEDAVMTAREPWLDVRVGDVLRDTENGNRFVVFGDILEGGGYFLIREIGSGEESRLQPDHVGGWFTRVSPGAT